MYIYEGSTSPLRIKWDAPNIAKIIPVIAILIAVIKGLVLIQEWYERFRLTNFISISWPRIAPPAKPITPEVWNPALNF